MFFDSKIFHVIIGLTVAYPLFLIAAVLFIRFINRNKQAPQEGERRRYPVLRRVLGALAWVPLGAMAVLAVWWFSQADNMGLDPFLYTAGTFVVVCPIILVLVTFYFLNRKNKS